MQNDYRRLVRAFDKSSIANFPSHEVELGGNTCNTSAKGCHDQSQPLLWDADRHVPWATTASHAHRR